MTFNLNCASIICRSIPPRDPNRRLYGEETGNIPLQRDDQGLRWQAHPVPLRVHTRKRCRLHHEVTRSQGKGRGAGDGRSEVPRAARDLPLPRQTQGTDPARRSADGRSSRPHDEAREQSP